ncbi:MAG: hypothetical protein NXY59_09345 [Aigarchaeota archaeon]|nr:hypothetical protein [Candidatus Pelearchaeum maunauluense]
MRKRATVLLLLIALLALTEANALVGPVLIRLNLPAKALSVAATQFDEVCIVVEVQEALYIYRDQDKALVRIALEGAPTAVAALDRTCIAVLKNQQRIALIETASPTPKYLTLPAPPSDVVTSSKRAYIISPLAGEIYELDMAEPAITKTIIAKSAEGRGMVSANERLLWVINEDYKSVSAISLEDGDSWEWSAGFFLTTILAEQGSDYAWVAAESRLVKLEYGRGVVEEVKLPDVTLVEPPLVIADTGELLYVSSVRRVVGLVSGGEYSETRTAPIKPASPAKGSRNSVWLVDKQTGTLAWLSTSRPPKIDEALLAYSAGLVTASFKVSDPDQDLQTILVMFHQLDERGRVVRNTTVPAVLEGGLYQASIEPASQASRVAAYAIAVDQPGNREMLKIGEVEIAAQATTVTAQTKTETTAPTPAEQPPADLGQLLFPLASGLLLLLPLLLGATLIFGRRRKRRKR